MLLPAGELVQLGSGLVRQCHPLQVLHGPGFGGLPVQAFKPAEVGHDLDDLFFLVQAAFLGQVSEAAAFLGPERLPVNVKGPGGGLVDPQQRPDGGGLPGTVTAQETERLTPVHVEGQVSDDCLVTKIHPKLVNMDKCFAHGCSPNAGRQVWP